MAAIVAVHGIAQELKGPETLGWHDPLRDGLRLAGVDDDRLPGDGDVAVGFWGDLFRPKGKSFGQRPLDANDLTDPAELELLQLIWDEAARTDPAIPGAAASTKARTPGWVQRALLQLAGSTFLAGMTERAFIGALKQVTGYLTDPDIRTAAIGRVAAAVSTDTKVVVAHSLGTVIAYEALAANPQWGVRRLVTMGSPLGIPNVVFDRLVPAPAGGVGAWPSVDTWVNIADAGDVVALRKQLNGLFDGPITDVPVNNGAKAHDASPYLTARRTGLAISEAL